MRQRSAWIIITVVALAAAVVGPKLIGDLRWKKVYGQFQDASSPYSNTDAVHAVGASNDKRSLALLVRIANNPNAATSNRIQALEMLAHKQDAVSTAQVALLLQPTEIYPIRKEAMRVIEAGPCGIECVSHLLGYLERTRGQEIDETTVGTSEQEDEFQRRILAFLGKSPQITAEGLRRIYGLGTRAPDPLAIIVAKEVGLKASCGDLESSMQSLKSTVMGAEIRLAIVKIGCETPPGR